MNNNNYSQQDKQYLSESIEMSQKSLGEGAFPAGAIIVKDNEILTKTTSAQFPKIIYHAESKSIDLAIEKLNIQLSNCVLYASMQPCLMCLSRSYWAGIRKIFYAISKSNVPSEICYESNLNYLDITSRFNEKIELVQIEELENNALNIVNKWLDNYNSK